MVRTDEFDYDLPEDLIAVTPVERRDESRLLVLDRGDGSVLHRCFGDLPDFLRPGDVLVMNDARVLPARLSARRETGGRVELLLVRRLEEGPREDRRWSAMVRGGRRLSPGEVLSLPGACRAIELCDRLAGGRWVVSLGPAAAERAILDAGSMPLPPYIVRSRRRRGMPEELPALDRERYQTVYAACDGAVAAPTAGLHFTEGLLDRVRERGVRTCTLSLLVGPGTFRPVKAVNAEEHELEAEFFRLPAGAARVVADALREGRRVVAIGTTTCRVLEHVARDGRWEEREGWTDLFVYPPYEFKVVDALVTNFHLPRSTLLMLVSALAGREPVLAAYREAVRLGYRFYSYGDAMFITPETPARVRRRELQGRQDA